MAKKCVFCTHPADSREHIFSDWMLEMLPSDQRYVVNERISTRDKYIRYPVRKVGLKAKVVCTPCNNNWMSDLEGLCKTAMTPLLFGDNRTTLTPKEIVPIAAFAFKTLLLANHKDLKAAPFFPFAIRRAFRLSLRIPDGVHIWMATREVLAGKYYGFWKSQSGGTDQESPFGFRSYTCTWNFQNLILQVLATKWDNKERRRTVSPISFPQGSDWEGASTLIWPSDGNNIPWPPPIQAPATMGWVQR